MKNIAKNRLAEAPYLTRGKCMFMVRIRYFRRHLRHAKLFLTAYGE